MGFSPILFYSILFYFILEDYAKVCISLIGLQTPNLLPTFQTSNLEHETSNIKHQTSNHKLKNPQHHSTTHTAQRHDITEGIGGTKFHNHGQHQAVGIGEFRNKGWRSGRVTQYC